MMILLPLYSLIDRLFGGIRCWNFVHFLHINEYGYTFEQNLAFSPLYPILVRILTVSWYNLLPVARDLLQFYSALLLTGVLVNVFAFKMACRALAELNSLIYGLFVCLFVYLF